MTVMLSSLDIDIRHFRYTFSGCHSAFPKSLDLPNGPERAAVPDHRLSG